MSWTPVILYRPRYGSNVKTKVMTINSGRMVWTPVMLYRPRMRSQMGYRETDKLCNEVEKLQPILDRWQTTKTSERAEVRVIVCRKC